MSKIIKVNSLNPELEVIKRAAEVIRAGGVVAFPTDTVYGLGANALDPDAVQRVFRIKGRDPQKPLIVLVADRSGLDSLVKEVPSTAEEPMALFWPGPLTLALRASPRLPPELLGGGGSLGVRVPAHPVALSLLQEVQVPLTAPSANLSGARNPIAPEEVMEQLQDQVDLILDGGRMDDRTPSTIVDLTGPVPTVLRVGRIPVEQIREVIPELQEGQPKSSSVIERE